MRSAQFRTEAALQNLAYHTENKPASLKNYFSFDLNEGTLVTEKDPKKVMAVLRLARKYSDMPDFGEHAAILDLVAYEKDLIQGGPVFWLRWPGFRPAGTITVRDWLRLNGQDPDSLLK